MVLPLLAKLQCSKTDWMILMEVARALGKVPDKRSIRPLYDLDNMTLKKLKEAPSLGGLTVRHFG